MTRLRRLTPTICAFHLGFSLVNYVRPMERTVIRYSTDYGAPLTALGGTSDLSDTVAMPAGELPATGETLPTVAEVNSRIGDMWAKMVTFVPRPEESPLKAYEQDGRVFLDDGVSGRQELLARTPMELMMMYEWATYVGHCSDDFVEQCWE